jgi:cobalt-zinc-cadmium efflux system membrane fusion protein
VERARQLFAADVIGRAELQRRERAGDRLGRAAPRPTSCGCSMSAGGDLAAGQQRGDQFGDAGGVDMAGTVVERRTRRARWCSPPTRWYAVADLSEVWVTAEVPEQQAALVRTARRWTSRCRPLARGSPASSSYVADTVIRDPHGHVRSRLDNAGGSSSRRCWRRC